MYQVLLVDDEAPDLEGLQTLVPWESFGMQAQWASNSAAKALEIIQREAVDLLVSDIRMPGMSGLDLFSRGKEYKPDLLAVFISGHADFSYAKRAIRENAAAYILKPVDDAELSEILKSVVLKLDKLSAKNGVLSTEDGEAKPAEARGHERLIIRDVKRAVEEELEQGVSLKELAARFGVTPNHLGFVFHQETGKFFSDYLTLHRLERAKVMLKDSQLKIYEVADKLGYKNISHFNRVFKDRYGLTPREYRDALTA